MLKPLKPLNPLPEITEWELITREIGVNDDQALAEIKSSSIRGNVLKQWILKNYKIKFVPERIYRDTIGRPD